MSNPLPPILSVCLNPAWQKTLFFERFVPGAVNRARALRECGGGKGVNLARALRCRNEAVITALFTGGTTGERLVAELRSRGVGFLAVPVPGPTRTCVTAVDETAGTVTELIEPSGVVPREKAEEMGALLAARIAAGTAGVALCGTLPPGVPAGIYARTAAAARAGRAPVLLDAVRGMETVLEQGVDLLKINRGELRDLTGESDPEAGCSRCFERFRVSWLGVTAGGDRAFLAGPDSRFVFRLPGLPRFRNASGAGDCASGVFLAEIAAAVRAGAGTAAELRPERVAAAFARALAAASASCMTELPALYDPAEQDRIEEKLVIERQDRIV